MRTRQTRTSPTKTTEVEVGLNLLFCGKLKEREIERLRICKQLSVFDGYVMTSFQIRRKNLIRIIHYKTNIYTVYQSETNLEAAALPGSSVFVSIQLLRYPLVVFLFNRTPPFFDSRFHDARTIAHCSVSK